MEFESKSKLKKGNELIQPKPKMCIGKKKYLFNSIVPARIAITTSGKASLFLSSPHFWHTCGSFSHAKQFSSSPGTNGASCPSVLTLTPQTPCRQHVWGSVPQDCPHSRHWSQATCTSDPPAISWGPCAPCSGSIICYQRTELRETLYLRLFRRKRYLGQGQETFHWGASGSVTLGGPPPAPGRVQQLFLKLSEPLPFGLLWRFLM